MITTTLILPDIHNRIEIADKIIKHVCADKVISLGDAFDSFDEDVESTKNTAEWFVEFINNPNNIYIAANHDMHYAWADKNFQCSGYADWKYFLINDIVKRSDWNKIKYYHILDDTWLVTHAGLHGYHLPNNISNLHEDRPKFLKEISEYLDAHIIKGHRNDSWIFRAGQARGGFYPIGGITWCDYTEEFVPIVGLNQILGHTPQGLGIANWTVTNKSLNGVPNKRPCNLYHPTNKEITDVNSSVNIDLDVHGNMHWAIWDGKTLKVHNYKDDL